MTRRRLVSVLLFGFGYCRAAVHETSGVSARYAFGFRTDYFSLEMAEVFCAVGGLVVGIGWDVFEIATALRVFLERTADNVA